MKIYIATSGSYSDYHIDAVFTNKKKAERYAEITSRHRGGYDEFNVEEYEADEASVETRTWFRVTKSRFSGWTGAYANVIDDIWNAKPKDGVVFDYYEDGDYSHEVWVRAESNEEARRIGLDKINIAEAEREGLV